MYYAEVGEWFNPVGSSLGVKPTALQTDVDFVYVQ